MGSIGHSAINGGRKTAGAFHEPVVGTSRCDVPARVVAGGSIAPLHAARTAQRAVPTTFPQGWESTRKQSFAPKLSSRPLFVILFQMNWANIQVISFDCYGTLIDWETGITSALQRMLRAHGIRVSDDDILQTYSRLEPAAQSGVYQPYRQVLRNIVRQFASAYGFKASESEENELAESLPDWNPFPDTVTALRALQKRFRLAILSNIDNDLFAGTARRLEVRFDWVITAENMQTYKPGLAHFQVLLAKTGLPPTSHVHAAESLYHDIAPARALGIPNVWIKRRHGERAANASQKAPVQPDYTVRDLAELVRLVGLEP